MGTWNGLFVDLLHVSNFQMPCPPVAAYIVGFVLYIILAKVGLESQRLEHPAVKRNRPARRHCDARVGQIGNPSYTEARQSEAIRKVFGRKSTLKPDCEARNVRQTAEKPIPRLRVGLQCPI